LLMDYVAKELERKVMYSVLQHLVI
jgi:hypothetical protein